MGAGLRPCGIRVIPLQLAAQGQQAVVNLTATHEAQALFDRFFFRLEAARCHGGCQIGRAHV